ncbi:MAG: hypothetical protein K2L89_05700, partial [Muribaculaceae bacterium]|nr:hypothetical protein [Muribaculaceae bacterium]
MSTLHIFNPESDIVLGLDQEYYTLGKYIDTFKSRLSLLPALYAEDGDFILIDNDTKNLGETDNYLETLPFYQLVKEKNLEIITYIELKKRVEREALFENDSQVSLLPFSNIEPWGWNKVIRRKLMETGIDPSLIPDDNFISNLRNISHRKITGRFFSDYAGSISSNFSSPIIIRNMEEAEDFITSKTDFCPDSYTNHPAHETPEQSGCR